jgi:hypothetical protein
VQSQALSIKICIKLCFGKLVQEGFAGIPGGGFVLLKSFPILDLYPLNNTLK